MGEGVRAEPVVRDLSMMGPSWRTPDPFVLRFRSTDACATAHGFGTHRPFDTSGRTGYGRGRSGRACRSRPQYDGAFMAHTRSFRAEVSKHGRVRDGSRLRDSPALRYLRANGVWARAFGPSLSFETSV